MAELTMTTFLTLDGVMQAPGGPDEDRSGGFSHGGWVAPHINDELGNPILEYFAKADAFLLGRNTYDIFASYWPKITDPNNLVAVKLNTLPKFVASRTRKTFDWARSTHVRDVVNEIAEIKRQFTNELQVHGSCGLAQTLIEHDLIDEYRFFIFPVVIGSGRRLFGSGAIPTNLTLEHCHTTGKGVIVCTYRRGGPFKSGTIGEEEPQLEARA